MVGTAILCNMVIRQGFFSIEITPTLGFLLFVSCLLAHLIEYFVLETNNKGVGAREDTTAGLSELMGFFSLF